MFFMLYVAKVFFLSAGYSIEFSVSKTYARTFEDVKTLQTLFEYE